MPWLRRCRRHALHRCGWFRPRVAKNSCSPAVSVNTAEQSRQTLVRSVNPNSMTTFSVVSTPVDFWKHRRPRQAPLERQRPTARPAVPLALAERRERPRAPQATPGDAHGSSGIRIVMFMRGAWPTTESAATPGDTTTPRSRSPPPNHPAWVSHSKYLNGGFPAFRSRCSHQ
jgi:hypothetical protein